MKPISRIESSVLHWVQPKALQRSFELYEGQEKVATLEWQKTFGSLALAETATDRWTLKRSGFLRPRVTARVEGSDQDVALFIPSWTGSGAVEFPNGRVLQWKPLNFWCTKWVFTGAQEEPLVQFSHEGEGLKDFFKTQARVELGKNARHMDELPLLVVLGLYLIILHQDDASAVAAATAATSS